ncbi:MAG: efflux RND transporter periplasmic adaptor subunit [Cyclobacteriaceae bacterium]|nr:efflux RND transporter periplasmic adaptor subunit [Cyclobacteriaceae bacterium]
MKIKVIIILLTTLTACKKEETVTAPSAFRLTDTISKGKELVEVTKQTVQSELILTGKITFDEDKVARVFPLAGGFVRDLNVELGDYVQKGQTMAIIRSPEIAGFTREGVAAESQVRLAEKNAQVAAELYKSGNVSEVELINAQKDLENAKGELARIQAVLDMYGAGTGSTYPIKAPVSGVIVQKNIALNMELRTEDISPVFIVGNLDEVWVMANIYESDITKIKEGFDAEITTIPYPDRVFKGKIDKIFNLMDAESKVVKARVTLPNRNFDLKPEMFANVKVTYEEPIQKLAVPSQALIFDKSRYFLMVYHADDNIETREVAVYKDTGIVAYIDIGVEAGERVMTKYQLLVYDALND